MSYILDALKRADAERERGSVPGLHARQVTGPAIQSADSRQYRVWMASAVMLALAGLGVTSLWFWQSSDAPVRLAAVESTASVPIAPTPMAQPVPAVPAIPAAPAVATSIPTTSPLAPPAAPKASPRPAPVARPVPVPAQPKPDPAAKEMSGQTAPSALPAPPAVRSFADLPEDLRRQIPALTITGSVDSKNPANRLLLVNNQVLAQGSLAASEVMLEEIQAKSSVFNFRGTRFRVAH